MLVGSVEQAAMAVVVSAPTFRFPVQVSASSARRAAHLKVPVYARVSSFRVGGLRLRRKDGSAVGLQICCAEVEGKSCCGGSGGEGSSSSNGSDGKCSSHGSSKSDVSNIGKEFEALLAQKTMKEFEDEYETGQMEGTISRDIIADVVNIYPDAVTKTTEEKFLDIDQLLAEAKLLSSSDGDFVFDADFEDQFV